MGGNLSRNQAPERQDTGMRVVLVGLTRVVELIDQKLIKNCSTKNCSDISLERLQIFKAL